MLLTKNKQNTAIIKNISEVADNMFLLDMLPKKQMEIIPGQFISVLCDNHTLRRPFSVMNYENDVLSVLFKRKGEGTAYISSLSIGDKIDFTGPFGNGFSINNKKSLLIGGGVGSAPLYFLKKYLSKKGIENFLMAGFQTVADIPEKMDIDFISTDDGSFKHKGFICDYLEEVIENYSPQVIYACGPFLLLKKIHYIAKQCNIPLYVAMEKEMACSIGVCRGCVIELSNGQNAAVCKDGPVFLSEAIKWD